jgi:membrane protein implicated in regulation of membrane protease activity
MEELVGRMASVSTRIRGGELPGEVTVRFAGEVHTFLAYAEEEIPLGTEVLIINSRGNHQVDVESWRKPGLGMTNTAITG